MPYDQANIFAKILRGEIPCRKIYEDEYALAFPDIRPQAPIHVLVIPKGAYADHADFVSRAGEKEIAGFEKAVGKVAAQVGAVEGGYRLIANCGADAHQEVPHYHVHIMAGRALGPMLAKMD
ncbi:MAG TPA: histidine triad nucleotide-binding protein [Alphaproteobacteria bacterium]|nr:histidine triad nucleotide-binding protein [Alphaproteobacteria bacterium]